MSEKQNCGIGDLSKYDAMTTEELEKILRLDVEAPEEQEANTDEILYIMEVLTKRKMNNSHTGKTAQEAYESFKENYMPETSKPKRSHGRTAAVNSRFPRWARHLTATAAVLAILICGSITAKAFGFNIWKAVVQWTQETFQFGEWDKSDTNDDLSYSSLQEVLEQAKITEPLVPTWFPEGYTLADITVEQSPLQKAYKAIYTNGKQTLRITVRNHLDAKPFYIEQSEGLIEEYDVLGITYYLFNNNERTQAVWIVDSFECRITGELTILDLKKMIASIKEG